MKLSDLQPRKVRLLGPEVETEQERRARRYEDTKKYRARKRERRNANEAKRV